MPNVVLTPNLEEAAFFLGMSSIGRDALGEAAGALRARGAAAVLLKGGHLDGDPADALATDVGVEIFTEPRIGGDDARHRLYARNGPRLRARRRKADRAGGAGCACVRSRATRKALTAVW